MTDQDLGRPQVNVGSGWVTCSAVAVSRLLVEIRPKTGSKVGDWGEFQKEDFENLT